MFSLWVVVRHVRQWFGHSVAVEMVVNGVLRTLWVSATMQNQLREERHPRRAESPMERLAPGQAKRHPGYVKQKYNIHALKGQKRKNLKALGMRNKSTISTLLPFQVGCSKLASKTRPLFRQF